MKKILIVEDDTAIAELERDYLEADGFAAHIAADGTKGLELAQKEAYDLLLLDVMLPGADGFKSSVKYAKKRISPFSWYRHGVKTSTKFGASASVPMTILSSLSVPASS